MVLRNTFKEMLEASMKIQNNDTIAALEKRRNQEQRDNRNSRRERKKINCIHLFQLLVIDWNRNVLLYQILCARSARN